MTRPTKRSYKRTLARNNVTRFTETILHGKIARFSFEDGWVYLRYTLVMCPTNEISYASVTSITKTHRKSIGTGQQNSIRVGTYLRYTLLQRERCLE